MTSPVRTVVRTAAVLGLSLVLTGCVLAPREAKRERVKLEQSGQPYAQRFEKRTIPDLPAEPTWQDVLHRAFLANGELEAAYFEWSMTVSRIRQAGTWPNAPVEVSFEYMFSGGNMKAWDRTTVAAGFMDDLVLPNKAYQSAKVATRDAQAAGERFAAAKFDLQRRVMNAWVDYALQAERVRIQRENVSLLKLLNETAAGRVRAGGSQQDLLRTDVEYRLAENGLRSMEAELPQMRAMLNAMLGRDAQAPLPAPEQLGAPRPVPADDAALLSIGVGASPELTALAGDVAGRRDALERARMEYLPDVIPMAGFTGSVSQFVGAGIMFPTALPRIRAMVDEARADLRRVEAVARQTRLDRAAEFVAAVFALRNAERQSALFANQILPAAEKVLANVRQSYTAGTGGYLDLIEAQRTLLDVRLMIAEARAEREKRLVDLEAIAGVDIETVTKTTTPTTSPTTAPATTNPMPAEVNHD